MVHALLDGRQTVVLRKGGIHEKRFELAAEQFLLFPTVAHGHTERVRPEHRELLDAAAPDSTAEAVVLRAAAKVVGAVEITRPDRLAEIEDLHIWTTASVRADRLDFRPRHRLTALVLSVRPLIRPVTVARIPEFGGCRSWVELSMPELVLGPAVVEQSDLAGITERVRRTVG